jgi:hypothetical protein
VATFIRRGAAPGMNNCQGIEQGVPAGVGLAGRGAFQEGTAEGRGAVSCDG